MTCLEAMASGNAIVVTSAGGTKEYAVDGKCGVVVPPADPAALSAAVVALLKDPGRRADLGRNARASAQSELTRTNIASQAVAVYSQAMQRHQEKAAGALYRHGDARFVLDAEALLIRTSECSMTSCISNR